MAKWINSTHPGIRYREHLKRKNGVKKDRYFAIYYRLNGKRKEEAIGWASKGWTEKKANVLLSELEENHRTGKGPQTLNEMREQENARKQKSQEIVKAKQKAIRIINEYFYQTYYPQIQREKKAATYQREESLFRLWIDKHVGGHTFQKVTKADIENIFYDMINSGRSIRSAEYALTTLKQIWREAKENGFASEMPIISKSLKTKISQNNNSRIRFLSHSEAERLLDELKSRSVDLYEKSLISLHCGLRASEIFKLTWSRVDMEHGIFNVLDSKGKDRSVHMSESVNEIMRSKSEGKPHELVFPGRENKISGQISQTFRQVANQLYNKDVVDRRERVIFHTLRHTCASWMVMQGINLYLVQKVLGHSTIQVTERYAHLAPDQLQLAANAINKSVMEHKSVKIIPFSRKIFSKN